MVKTPAQKGKGRKIVTRMCSDGIVVRYLIPKWVDLDNIVERFLTCRKDGNRIIERSYWNITNLQDRGDRGDMGDRGVYVTVRKYGVLYEAGTGRGFTAGRNEKDSTWVELDIIIN